MRNVLIVCMDNFPVGGACGKLLNNLVVEGKLAEKIGKVDILSINLEQKANQCEEYHGTRIYRVHCWSIPSINQIINIFRNRPLSMINAMFIKLKNAFVRRVFSHKYLFSPDIVKVLCDKISSLHHLNNYDYIIPITGEMGIAKATMDFCIDESVPYIPYLMDPISTNYIIPKHLIDDMTKFEYEYYKNAESILITPLMKKEVHDIELLKKMHEIEFPNVSRICDMATSKSNANSIVNNEINCVFTGMIYKGVRDPEYTLNIFRELSDRVSLTMVGVSSDEIDDNLKFEKLHCVGKKTIEETKIYVQKADFLVNIGNVMTNQVPSKLFDYISTGLPIINICKNTNCPTLDYLKKYDNSISVFEYDSIETNTEMIEQFIEKNINVKVCHEEIVNSFIKCTPEYCSTVIENIINSSNI